MRYARLLPIAAALAICLALLPPGIRAQVVNGNATAAATAKPIGTSTPVNILLPNQYRCSYTINWVEAGNLMCAPILDGTTPIYPPTSTNGFKMSATKTPWIWNTITGDPRYGWACICDTSVCNVFTIEDLSCAARGAKP